MTDSIDRIATGLKAVNKAIQEPPCMTRRERIADWFTGGRYSLYKYHSLRLEYFAREMDKANLRLDRIAAQETPGANATVKRTPRIARGEEG